MRDCSQKKYYFAIDSSLAKERMVLPPCKISSNPLRNKSKRDKIEKIASAKSKIYYSYRAAKKHINSL